MDNDSFQLNSPQSLVVEMDFEENKPKVVAPEEQSIQQPNDISDGVQHSEEKAYVPDQQPDSEAEREDTDDDHAKKPRSKKWERERRAREEKYALVSALAEEKRRNLELQDYLKYSIDNNTLSAADKAMRQLEMAEKSHASALERGDALAAAKASTALIQANLALERVANSRMYSQDNEHHASESRRDINPAAYAANNLLNDWLADNPEFNEDSGLFNEELVSRVSPLIDKLDAKLRRQGKAHLISSPLYFDVIDTLVSQVKSGRGNDRPRTAPVSSRSYVRESKSTFRPRLTEQQKLVAAGCNMTEEQYANWLAKYAKEKFETDSNRNNYGY